MVSFMKLVMAALVHKGYGNNYNDCHMYIPNTLTQLPFWQWSALG